MTTCPMCAEDIGANDAVCPHCGNVLGPVPKHGSAPVASPTGPTPVAAPTSTAPGAPASPSPRPWKSYAVPAALTAAVAIALVVKFVVLGTAPPFNLAALGVPGDTTFRCTRNEALGSSHCTAEGGNQCGYFAAAMAMERVARNEEPAQTFCTEQEVAFCFSYRSAGLDRDYPACNMSMTDCRATADRFRSNQNTSRVSQCAAVSVRGGRFVLRDASPDPPAAAAAAAAAASPPPEVPSDASTVAQTPPAPPSPIAAPAAPPPPPPPAPDPTPAPLPAPEVTLTRLVPTRFTASSFISNGRNQYAPDRAFDGDPATTWTEAARGPGDGEWLQATFATPQHIERVRITPGWNHTSPRGEDLFIANSHLRRVRLVLGPNTTIERDVSPGEREVVINGLDAETTTVRIEALSVWPGTRWADLCIGDVVIEGEPLADGPVAVPSPPAGPNDSHLPPPCIANCIRAHRAAYVRCADACVRQGDRGAECNQECGRDYDRCLSDECHFDADGTPWFRPDLSVPAAPVAPGPCTYATRDSFHLRASPTASRAGAVEITTNPVVELLHAERQRRGHERMFQVRLPDGREGWMFVPEAEIPAGCER